MLDVLIVFWPFLTAAINLLICLVASAHVVLHKRDTRAAIGWVGIIWLAPLIGPVLYLVLGINRIRRRAHLLRADQPQPDALIRGRPYPVESLHQALGSSGGHLASLVKLVDELTRRQLMPGNRIEPLINGDQAYPAMLEAIEGAQRSLTLSTYIFDNDRAGEQFLEALAGAVRRGVEVRVLVDDVGSRHSWPSMLGRLRRAGIRMANFLPTLGLWGLRYTNLRSHRKILVVDGRLGFTGGMNIREGNVLQLETGHSIQDLHFRVEGPVVAHLQEVFAVDWAFCTGELLDGELWFPPLAPARQGRVLARGISDGPDGDFEKLPMTLLGALSSARSSVCIVTPYFLPDTALIYALNVTAMRGVSVDIVLPEHSNWRLVQWASYAHFWQLLEHGCRIWLSPPPFDHSKLMLVDGLWTLLGSANWDPRSLRLNFEFNLECYDSELAGRLIGLARAKLQQSQPVTLEGVQNRHLLLRLRDGVARLLSPYL